MLLKIPNSSFVWAWLRNDVREWSWSSTIHASYMGKAMESNVSSDSASVLSLCYSSSSFEESSSSNSDLICSDSEQESSVIEPYLYEPKNND